MNIYISSPSLPSLADQLKYDATFHTLHTLHPQTVYLRIWEHPYYTVVLGRSNKAALETYDVYCHEEGIPIETRSSGGGCVLLGPGCLCYSLYLHPSHKACHSITSTNHFIMETTCRALHPLNNHIHIAGFTDLCINNIKFSGNAQRRTREAILFHGTILYNFDLTKISRLLKHPSKEPDYRKKRTHAQFLCNLNHSKSAIVHALRAGWHCL